MNAAPLNVKRLPSCLEPDSSRVIPRLFRPGDDARIRGIIERIMTLSDVQAALLVNQLKDDFAQKHLNIDDVVAENFAAVQHLVPEGASLSAPQRLLMGAYFTMEYALESAALFNPSMIPSMDQTNLPAGSTRFLMSLRATGEGHISSIVFRHGVVDGDGNVMLDPPSPYRRPLKVVEDRAYDKSCFRQTLTEMGADMSLANTVFQHLNDSFDSADLGEAIQRAKGALDDPADLSETAENMLWLARSNYHLEVPADAYPSEIVIFPTSENESRGIEDVRLVLFTEDDGKQYYYGTYTAYNGFHIVPQLIEAEGLGIIEIHTMNGRYAKNKGMALFPRRIGGRYVMSGRLDNESLYILESDNIRFWDTGQVVQKPRFWWEMVQIGNCGSPLETEAGWLLLTHGVGPMRQYCIGATLMDRHDPTKIIGQSPDPILVPTGEESIGYVPNVVYSCGGMIHNDTLIIPYAMSDIASSFATVSLPELLDYLTTPSRAEAGVR